MSAWKCIASGNILYLDDYPHTIEEMKRNKSYIQVKDDESPKEDKKEVKNKKDK